MSDALAEDGRGARVDEDLVASARGLIELADADAVEAEAQGALTDAVVKAFHDTGLWAMWVPRSLGGGELEPVPSLEVIELSPTAMPPPDGC